MRKDREGRCGGHSIEVGSCEHSLFPRTSCFVVFIEDDLHQDIQCRLLFVLCKILKERTTKMTTRITLARGGLLDLFSWHYFYCSGCFHISSVLLNFSI